MKQQSPPSPMGAQRDALRKHLRKARKSITPAQQHKWSERIAENSYPLLRHAHSIGGYLAIGGEVCVDGLMAKCRANCQYTLVPVLSSNNTLMFAPFNEHTPMSANRFGIYEPSIDESLYHSPNNLDVALVPLVGFDRQCNRMGMGGGYYDRSFAYKRTATAAKPLLVGVAYHLQCVECVFPDWWDVALDYVVTESDVFRRSVSVCIDSPQE